MASPAWSTCRGAGSRQVHGTAVVDVRRPRRRRGRRADGLVTAARGPCSRCRGADCRIVALVAAEGVIGVAHAGWRGLLGGVLEATVATMRRPGATAVRALPGPCIQPPPLRVRPEDLARAAARLGRRRRRPHLRWPSRPRPRRRGRRRPGLGRRRRRHPTSTAAPPRDPTLYSHRARGDARPPRRGRVARAGAGS